MQAVFIYHLQMFTKILRTLRHIERSETWRHGENGFTYKTHRIRCQMRVVASECQRSLKVEKSVVECSCKIYQKRQKLGSWLITSVDLFCALLCSAQKVMDS
jgi:hypothetical protein